MKSWKTDLILSPSDQPIGLNDALFTIGSCFAETMGKYFADNKFNTAINPFGTVYNPISIHQLLRYAIKNELPAEHDYLIQQEIHYHYQFHSSFSSLEKSTLSKNIYAAIQAAHQFITTCNYLIITYGSAFIYRKNDTNEWVSNCHKMPPSNFSKELLTIAEMQHSFADILQKLKTLNPSLKIILTVSPVRHLNDTLELNAVSKSSLRLLCHELVKEYDVDYFPAYEIMMDDLRDYRFYKPDRIHPTEEAEEYIWNKFAEKYFNEEAKHFIIKWKEIKAALLHRTAFVTSKSHQLLLKSTLKKLEEANLHADVTHEMELVRSQLIA